MHRQSFTLRVIDQLETVIASLWSRVVPFKDAVIIVTRLVIFLDLVEKADTLQVARTAAALRNDREEVAGGPRLKAIRIGDSVNGTAA